MLTARLAIPNDAARIAEIYNQGIEDRIATFETELRTVEAVRSWFSRPYPIVVVEREGEVIAWANASEYRARACYAQNCEFSVYVDRSVRGSGAGTLAMRTLITEATTSGYHKLISRVFVENEASLGMLAKVGFRQVGLYREHGQLDGVWRDVVIVECILGDRNGSRMAMHSGQHVTIVKQHFRDEKPSISYSGVVLPYTNGNWLAFACTWTLPDMNVDGVRYETGGRLIEYFAPDKRYNIFRVYDRAGIVTGLYGNVTAPIFFAPNSADDPVLTWIDQYLDVIKLPDGSVHLLDEDEYLATGIPQTDPVLDAEIRAAAAELIVELESGRWDDVPGSSA
ncbi:MAG: GNAT family N-acetyltransferase [Thermomicrobiales bacterium]|nr:GNAT family N-acetyltransferase [Thermomicrobiales bacterium]